MIDSFWIIFLSLMLVSTISIFAGFKIGRTPSDNHVIGNLIIHDTPEGKEMYIQLSSENLNVISKQKNVILKVVNVKSQK